MDLVLRLKGQEIARLKLTSTSNVMKEVENLRNQYREQIRNSDTAAEFGIENVPSSINAFQPLRH